MFNNHILSIYRYDKEEVFVTANYFKKGLKNNIKCIYISSDKNNELLTSELRSKILDLDKYIKSGQLLLLNQKDVYVKNDTIPIEQIIKTADFFEDESKKQGFTNIIFSGEPFLTNTKNQEIVINYENHLDKYLNGKKFIVLCHYSESKYQEETLLKMIKSHSSIIIYGEHRSLANKNIPNKYDEAINFILESK